jgi:Na+-transporting methylmalonyl-CoA/oxaloacetate decarboxylase gamma subunit
MLLGVRFVLLALLVLVVAAFFVARPSEAQEQQSGGES